MTGERISAGMCCNLFGKEMFETIIPDTVKISEAPSFGISIFEHDPNGTGSKTYRELMNEVLKRW